MVVHVEPRLYGSLASRYNKAPIFNLDLLMALYQFPPAPRDVYAHDEGLLVLEDQGDAAPQRALLDATSSDAARELLEVLDEDAYLFTVRERWLTMVVQAAWDVDFQEVEPKRYSTDSKHFSGQCKHRVIELTEKDERRIRGFVEDRDDFEEHPPLEDLLVWKQKGRDCRIFASLSEAGVKGYLLAVPICVDLDGIWHVSYLYTQSDARKRGYAASMLCAATEALLESDRIPVVTPFNPKMQKACEKLGFFVSDDRLQGLGTRLA